MDLNANEPKGSKQTWTEPTLSVYGRLEDLTGMKTFGLGDTLISQDAQSRSV